MPAHTQLNVNVSFTLFSFAYSDFNRWPVVAYVGLEDPERERDFAIIGETMELAGWRQYTHRVTLTTGTQTTLWIAFGFGATWETPAIYFFMDFADVTIAEADLPHGDVDGDSQVTLADLRLLFQMLLGQVTPNLIRADLDRNEQLTLEDARELVQLLGGDEQVSPGGLPEMLQEAADLIMIPYKGEPHLIVPAPEEDALSQSGADFPHGGAQLGQPEALGKGGGAQRPDEQVHSTFALELLGRNETLEAAREGRIEAVTHSQAPEISQRGVRRAERPRAGSALGQAGQFPKFLLGQGRLGDHCCFGQYDPMALDDEADQSLVALEVQGLPDRLRQSEVAVRRHIRCHKSRCHGVSARQVPAYCYHNRLSRLRQGTGTLRQLGPFLNGVGLGLVLSVGLAVSPAQAVVREEGTVHPSPLLRHSEATASQRRASLSSIRGEGEGEGKLPVYAKGQLLVKFKTSGPHALRQCAHCLFRHRSPMASAAADASGSLDALVQPAGVRDIQPLFPQWHHREAGQAQAMALTAVEAVRRRFPQRQARAPVGAEVPDLSQTYVVSVPAEADIERLVAQYQADPHVAYAQPNYLVEVQMVPNDPYHSSSNSWGQGYDDLWGLKKIHAAEAWDVTQGGIVVAVVDTGVDYTHPDLAANIWTNPGEIPGNGLDDDANGFVDDRRGWNFVSNNARVRDNYGHGTHVAGTIAAVGNNGLGILGIAPQARVMAVKGLNHLGEGTERYRQMLWVSWRSLVA